MNLEIRLINPELNDANTNMALDEAFFQETEGKEIGVLRAHYWNRAISLGRDCDIEKIKHSQCVKEGVEITRRSTGGNYAAHTEGDFGLTLILPYEVFGRSVTSAFRWYCQTQIKALKKLGIDAEQVGLNDIVYEGSKLVGSAQVIKGDRIMLQSIVSFSPRNRELLLKYINFEKAKEGTRERIESWRSISEILEDKGERKTKEEIYRVFRDTFEEELSKLEQIEAIREDKIKEEERKSAIYLVAKKYSTKEWTYEEGREEKGEVCLVDLRED